MYYMADNQMIKNQACLFGIENSLCQTCETQKNQQKKRELFNYFISKKRLFYLTKIY